MMMKRGWEAAALAAAVGVAAAAGCGESVRIRERIPPEEERIACVSLADCEAVGSACRTAVGCEGGWCLFEDAPEGTSVVCYGGPAETAGKGICQAGLQQCDGAGNPVGGCVGEVVPGVESCAEPLDEDCDGLVDEEGEGCTCGDGIVSAGLGETCDDGATSDGDSCSPTCQAQEVLGMAASEHTCAVLSQGAVKCWGRNDWGQLGLGDTAYRGDGPGEMGDSLPAVNLGSGRAAVALAVATQHTCALLSNGSVKCWGYNNVGQLGLEDTADRGDGPGELGDDLPVVDLGSGKTAVAITAGTNYTCALLNDGAVKCWGSNLYGQLGIECPGFCGDWPGEMGDNLPAVDLGSGKTAVALAAGGAHTCAVLNDGSVKCWGWNFHGQLGLGDTLDRGEDPGQMGDNLPAVDLGSGKTAVAVTAGALHTCAVLNDGGVKCWGYNSQGALGLGDTAIRGDGPGEMGDDLPAADLGSGKTTVAVAAGIRSTCALLNDGSVKCWGYNAYGRLGLGDDLTRGNVPGQMGDELPAVDLGTGRTAVGLAAGAEHVCARLDDGSAKCWGRNIDGQLGLGDTLDRGDSPDEVGDALPTVKLFSALW